MIEYDKLLYSTLKFNKLLAKIQSNMNHIFGIFEKAFDRVVLFYL